MGKGVGVSGKEGWGKCQAERMASINEQRGERAASVRKQQVDACDWSAGRTGKSWATRPDHKGLCGPNQ